MYKTKDLAEAGTLILLKQRLISIEREGRVCWFVFQNRGECERLSNQFFFGECLVNARDYHEALGRLKNRIFQLINEDEKYKANP
ncbi:hypothetical protein A3B50_00610 [Candidatus Roizmanbacteria bacterium RIFCSPLOWO2_01_FULL_40_42]|uniref:DUF5659 domain-containing protein n=1 Tax=Candidatus Roizmanbacteria bacterium RIFCSPLOWO2_01_FULL_40_42 TaxID=1802066 RepID=A0A1F7J4W6_9BACT|nr:MAG: hypothetical protein A2779_01515 [Candidatus Roizmanbacteria bacterium RIFCSPHIGHO2_01_FULL_40_98]OGK29038.1 MAG: hypothetical protein A3C31_02155 [Candidatus Roizmanbacteria bacterium RIFCSPHIGHO2_02_FULL_40_53]OGK36293.1 MAG: hypothetical protein A3E69_03600 [Candidatus Roizmanbacteria bacterium RIFCSPHIGHO2_12_FULL_40_130]OGK50665.1 MAG: hypothetical protein A3B50_00610 [Candidatus Roizmanbacteria bacterium RIFCSPLOWO2_01_FULL_40_42]